MIRKIIEIDSQKCNGCGACAAACHEGAIGMVNGKAKLLRDDYCDGLGDCLPTCPTGAISFVEREAAAYDEAAVLRNKQEQKRQENTAQTLPCGCPGTRMKQIRREPEAQARENHRPLISELSQWPVQLKLAPVAAPWLQNADLLIAADCSAYAFADFHNRFIRGKITLIGCPKLDGVDYTEKLTEILRGNSIRSITVTRMEVPCCAGLVNAVKNAIDASGKQIPLQTVILSTDGEIIHQ